MKKFAIPLKDADPSSATLSSVGLTVVDEPERKCFGMVYELPPINAMASDETSCQQRSLSDALASDSRYAISERLYIASGSADAVYQLHTAGWLHKNIRSQDVIFSANSASHQTGLEWSEPCLLAHENIRPDSAESAQLLTTVPQASLANDLYRHPEKRGSAGPSFQKRFDLYGLGCVLIELATWAKLVDVHSALDKQSWGDAIVKAEQNNVALTLPSFSLQADGTKFDQYLSHFVCAEYIAAVKLCLQGPSHRDEEALNVGIETQADVAKKLHQCARWDS